MKDQRSEIGDRRSARQSRSQMSWGPGGRCFIVDIEVKDRRTAQGARRTGKGKMSDVGGQEKIKESSLTECT
jgi:hypothetical protein